MSRGDAVQFRASKIIIASLMCLALLAACDEKSAKKAEDKTDAAQSGVTISQEDAEHLGIKTEPIRQIQYTAQARGYGAVVSFDTLAQSAADVATAQAAARQSRAALAHNRSLASDNLITREALEVAQRQVATDDAQVLLAERKQAVAFGRNAPWRMEGENGPDLSNLASGKYVLVHITFPPGDIPAGEPGALLIQRVGGAASRQAWKALKVWAAPADPTIPGTSFFALVEGSGLNEGERVLASVPVGIPMIGAEIPTAAVVLSGSESWCYTQSKPGVFVHHVIDTSRPTPAGYFVTGDLKAGQAVVVQGASLLLSREISPSSPSTSDSD